MKFLLVGVGITGFLGMVLSTYKKCPSDSLLVRYGVGGTKILEGKGTLVIPFLQSYKLMSLNPHNLDIALDEDSGVATKDKIRIEVEADATFAISKEENERIIATERLLNFKEEKTVNLVKEILTGQLRSIVSEMNFEDLLENRKKLMEKVSESTEVELSKFGLDLMNFNIKMIKDLDGIVEQLGKKASAIAKSGSEISIAEQEKISATSIANSNKEKDVSIAETNAQKTKSVVSFEIQQTEAEERKKVEITELEYNTELKNSNIKITTEKEIELNEINSQKEIEINNEKNKQDVAAQKILTLKKEYELATEEKRVEYITSTNIENEAKKLIAQNELEVTKIEAEKMLIDAKAKSDSMMLEAKAKAELESLPIIKKAEAEKKLFEVYGAEGLVRLKLIETLPELMKHSVDAIKELKIDSINVISSGGDSQGAVGGEIGATVNNIITSIPAFKIANSLAKSVNLPELELNGHAESKLKVKTEERKIKHPKK